MAVRSPDDEYTQPDGSCKSDAHCVGVQAIHTLALRVNPIPLVWAAGSRAEAQRWAGS